MRSVCILLIALVFASRAVAEQGKLRERLTPEVMAVVYPGAERFRMEEGSPVVSRCSAERPVMPLVRSNSVIRRDAVGDESNPSCALVRRRSAYSPALDDSVRDGSARRIHVPLAENGVRPAE